MEFLQICWQNKIFASSKMIAVMFIFMAKHVQYTFSLCIAESAKKASAVMRIKLYLKRIFLLSEEVKYVL